MIARKARPYANPYLCGVGLGLVLLTAYGLAGRGLGASGAFASIAATSAASVSDEAKSNAYFARYLQDGGPINDWLVFELAGVVLGAFVSAWLAGRLAISIDRGDRISNRGRLLTAPLGGLAMGAGAVLARGCTSGQGLSGGALLSVGSWLFLAAAFAGGFAAAPMLKRIWQ